MSVLMVATYDEDGTLDVKNPTWDTMDDMKKIALNLTETHKTVKNIKRLGHFMVGIADMNL